MKRHALVIINVGESDSALYSRPLMRRYCEKYGIDLVELREPRLKLQGCDPTYQYRNFEKFQAYDCLESYARILRLDTDVLISPAAPNLFEIVPPDRIGVVFEDCGRRAVQRHAQMERVARSFAGAPWGERRYFNSGIMVFSECHRDVLHLTDADRRAIHEGDLGGCKEQNLCNWKVRNARHPLQALDYRYNHLSMFSERWNGKPHRLGSFLIHYAGNQQRKPRRMRRDSRRLTRAWETGKFPLLWWYRLMHGNARAFFE